MKLAVVIPTYKAHLKYIESLLKNISLQTRLPDLVIVRASSCKPADYLVEHTWPFPLKILYTENRQYAAQNRNEGADAVPGDFDAISFIDSDDLMYPLRLEMVEQFLKQGADAVFHNCTRGSRESAQAPIEDGPMSIYDSICLQKETMLNMIDNKDEIFFRPIPMDENLEEEFAVQFAHATVRKGCFTAVRFNEGAFRYEDAQFVSDIVARRYKTVTLKNQLSHYTIVDEEEEQKKYDVLITENAPVLP